MANYEAVFCIVNTGFSELVMDAAKEVGARGGTVLHARGTANKEAEQFFHITIQPDKEIVMILVTADIKDAVLHAIYQHAGLKSEGQGIAFSMPVDDVVGISGENAAQPQTDKNNKQNAESKQTSENAEKAVESAETTPEQPAEEK